MSDWKQVKLGDVCTFDKMQGKHSSLPYVGMEHISSSTGQFMGTSSATEVQSLTFKFTPKHVLYGRLRPYLNKVLLPDFVGHCSTEIFPILPNSNVERRWLFYWLTSDAVVAAINDTCTGARMPRANMNAVLNFRLPLPPLAVQQAIVAKLDAAFASIDTAIAAAEKNAENAKQLFQSYLSDVFERGGEGWVKKNFDEICVLQRGFDLPTQSRISGDYPLVSSNGITDSINDFKVSGPGVVTGRSGTIGNVHYIEKSFWPLNTALYIKDFHGNVPKFVFYFLRFFRLERFASGAGVPTLNRNVVHAAIAQIPIDARVQESLAAKFDNCLQLTLKLELVERKKIQLYGEIKQSLLQQAFSGQLVDAQR